MRDSEAQGRHEHVSAGHRPASRGARRGGAAENRAGTVSVRALTTLLAVGVKARIPRDILLAAAHVTDADLAEPDGRLPLAAEIALWQTFARSIADPGFGVRAGAAFSVRSGGLLGYVMRFSARLRNALRRAGRYGRIFTEAVQFALDEEDAHGGFALSHPALGPGLPFAEDYRLAAVLHVCCELTSADIVPMNVAFTHKQPSSTLAFREFFRCRVTYGEAVARIDFRASDLDLPVVKADETLAGYLSDHAEQVLATLVRGDTVQNRVRAAIWSLLGNGKPSLTQVAVMLRMPPRTLQRWLRSEGTTFHREVGEIRRSMATATLRDRSIPIGEIAFLLGYSEPSAFFRSFKRWTGTTPRNFRSVAT